MNFRILWLVLVGVFAYLLFYEWSEESKIKSELVASSRVAPEGGGVFSASTTTISNQNIQLSIDIESGSIVGVELRKYPVFQGEGSPNIRLLGSENSFKFYARSGYGNKSITYKVAEQSVDSLLLISDDGSHSKEFNFEKDYVLNVVDQNLSASLAPDPYVALYRTDGTPLDSRGGFFEGSSYVGVAFNTPDDPYKNYRLRSIDRMVNFDQYGGWVSFIQKYFLTSVIVDPNQKASLFVQPPSGDAGVYSMGVVYRGLDLQDQQTGVLHKLYFGPKIRSDLMSVAPDLELSIDMGWFWFLAQPLVMLLVAINSFVGNWGFSIIILTVLLKLLLWPISAAGYRSMAKMRVVQPKLQEIQSQYKDDRQKLGVEMMALYRKEKINPAGGCFPMLVQIPVFIALFFALREVVELRHAPFILWVQDLSAPDPLFIMPFLMAGLMYLTQQLNPTPPNMDPVQMQVMKIMPVAISVIFIWLPSSLVLYSVANAAFSLVQQKMMYNKYGASDFKAPGGG